MGLRLLEALASLLLSSRHDLTPAAERPLLLLTSLLAQRLDPAQPRLRTLIDTDRLPDVLGGGIPPYSVGTVLAVQCERANELERRIAEEEVKQLDQVRACLVERRGGLGCTARPNKSCTQSVSQSAKSVSQSRPDRLALQLGVQSCVTVFAGECLSNTRTGLTNAPLDPCRRWTCRVGWQSLRGNSRR